jgi:serine O-acetyltransferase
LINSKKQLLEYLAADRIANAKKTKKPRPFTDYEWRFLIALRKLEYQVNCAGNKPWDKLILLYRKAVWSINSVRTGITIYPNSFGKGLTLWHYGYVVVNDTVKGGDFVTLQCGVNISENCTLGNWTYLAPGAKVLKNVSIADNVLIGANGVVTKSIEEPSTTWVGVPVRKIADSGYARTIDYEE